MGNNNLVVRRDENLLIAARNTFGVEMIQDAFVAIAAGSKESELDKLAYTAPTEDLSLDPGSIVLKLSNGRFLHFNVSEWLQITVINKENFSTL